MCVASRPFWLSILLGASLAACDDGGQGRAQAPDETVRVSARHPSGVPVHPTERGSAVSGRLPDGASVEVVRWAHDRRWLEVRGAGVQGWITARYVARPEPPATPSVWASGSACGAQPPIPRRPGRARVGSWNLRWFPDGSSGGPSAQATDVSWMACVIASLRVDVLAVQEVMLHARGRAAIERLERALSQRAGGRWRSHFDDCPRDGRQHVGFLYDADRVELRSARTLAELNPGQGGCAHRLRPGVSADLRFRGGLDLFAVVVHLDSGVEDHDLSHRRASVAALGAELLRMRAARADDDVLVLGDFNTMGCESCGVSAAAELGELDAQIRAARLRRVETSVPCTEYYRGRGGRLDHVLASASMRALAPDAVAEVGGPCATYACSLPRGVRPPAHEHLSDHCPVVVELLDAP